MAVQQGCCMKYSPSAGKSNRLANLVVIQVHSCDIYTVTHVIIASHSLTPVPANEQLSQYPTLVKLLV